MVQVDVIALTDRFSCRCPIVFSEQAQFSFWHGEFRGATIQTDNNLWEYPHDGPVDVFQSGEVDAHLSGELALGDGAARLAGHTHLNW